MSVALRLYAEQMSLKDNELQRKIWNASMAPLSVTLPEIPEKLRSKQFVFLNRNLEDVDLIRTIIPPVETETGLTEWLGIYRRNTYYR